MGGFLELFLEDVFLGYVNGDGYFLFRGGLWLVFSYSRTSLIASSSLARSTK